MLCAAALLDIKVGARATPRAPRCAGAAGAQALRARGRAGSRALGTELGLLRAPPWQRCPCGRNKTPSTTPFTRGCRKYAAPSAATVERQGT